MIYATVFLMGVLTGCIVMILRLGIKGNLAIHYVNGEDKPYMCLELNKDVESVVKNKVIVLRVRVRDSRGTQK